MKTFKRPVTGDSCEKRGGGGWGGGRGGGKAPSPMNGSLRRFQKENENANCTVLSGKKICAPS